MNSNEFFLSRPITRRGVDKLNAWLWREINGSFARAVFVNKWKVRVEVRDPARVPFAYAFVNGFLRCRDA